MKNNNAPGYFPANKLMRCFILIAFIFSFAETVLATSYTVSTNVDASTLAARTEDTLYIDAIVTLSSNQTWDFNAVIMRAPNGTIFWANNSNLSLPNCVTFNIETGLPGAPGLEPTGGNASKLLILAGVKVAVSNDNSNNAAFSFEEFTYIGGLPKFTITTNSPICNGEAFSIMATPDRSSSISYNYNWTISPVSGTFNPASSNSSYASVTTISPSSGNYVVTCTIKATGDPLATVTANLTVNGLPAVPVSVSATPSILCAGGSGNLKATSTGNIIQWYTVANGGTNIGTSASAANFSFTPVSTTTYYAEAITPPGCKSATRAAVTSTVNPLPTAFSVTGGGSYCFGGSGIVIGLSGSQAGVNYQLYNGASAIGSVFAGTGSALSFGTYTSAGAYTVTATKATTSCTNNMTGNAAITINSRPTSVIGTLAQNICNGGSATISVTLTGTGPWNLTYFDGSISTMVNNISSSPYTFNVSPGSAKTYTVMALSDANCTSIISDRTGSATLTVNPRPTGILNGSATICKGTSVNASLAVTGSGTISGTLSDGTTFTGTAPTITVNVNPGATQSYSIATLTNSSCSSINADLSGTFNVTVIDPVLTTISSQPIGTTFCAGSNTAFSVSTSGAGSLTYIWQVSTDGINYTDASGSLYSGAATNSLTIIGAPATLSGNYYRVIINSALQCSVPVISNGVQLLLKNYWTGLTSTDWNTPGNWTGNTIPTLSCDDVYISGGSLFQPVINDGTIAVNNLIINSGAVLTVNGIIQVAGAVTNAGIFDVTNGGVEFNGASGQSVSSNLFYNNKIKDLIISNNVSLESAISLSGILSFGSSGKTFNTNGNLTLKSTVANTSAVSQVINNNTITGEVTVERYISSRRAWRLLAIPTQTSQSVKTAWQESSISGSDNLNNGYGTQITDNTATWMADGFDYYSADGPSVKRYDPVGKKYIGIASTFVGIASTEGWMTFVRGDRTVIGSAASTSTVLRTKGSLKIGTQPVITVPAGQFISVANPYASPLDMRNISKSGTLNSFYVWDPYLGTSYGAFQIFSPGADGNYRPTPGYGSYSSPSTPYNYIQSGAAFFISGNPVPAANGNITITESSKAGSVTGNVMRPVTGKVTEPQIRINLYEADNANLSLLDGTLSQFDNKYDTDVDIFDVKKLSNFNSSEELSLKTKNQLLAIEKRQTTVKADTIFLNVEKMRAKSYRFEFIAENFNPAFTAFLEDNYYKTRIPLNINGTSVYDFKVMNTEGSTNAGRFYIVLMPAAVKQMPVTFSKVKAIIVYPNPIVDGNINFQLINQPKGRYGIRLFNKLGQVMMTRQIEHAEGNSMESLRINKKIAHGPCRLEVTRPDNSQLNIDILYQ
ncbi:MAG: hypothetical protein ABIN97_13025 [Ginsengibacter sp.]